jgi:hypothetical protein
MSTRAVIARPRGDGFAGRYHHWDGYPSGLGATLFWLSQPNDVRTDNNLPPTPWDGDIEAMQKVLLDDHTGWSTINGGDFRKAPGMIEGRNGTCRCGKTQNEHYCQYNKESYPCKEGDYGQHLGHAFDESAKSKADAAEASTRPQCYCHGDRSEEGWDVDEHNASGSGCEYAYVIHAPSKTMTVLSSFTEFEGQTVKMVGAFGMGDPNGEWKPIGVVDLRGMEPNWERLYESQYDE